MGRATPWCEANDHAVGSTTTESAINRPAQNTLVDRTRGDRETKEPGTRTWHCERATQTLIGERTAMHPPIAIDGLRVPNVQAAQVKFRKRRKGFAPPDKSGPRMSGKTSRLLPITPFLISCESRAA